MEYDLLHPQIKSKLDRHVGMSGFSIHRYPSLLFEILSVSHVNVRLCYLKSLV